MVKTHRFKTIGSIPDDWGEGKSVEGLVINRSQSLDNEAKDLIRQNFPNIDLDRVLLVEEGREPKSKPLSLGMIAGGGGLSVVGLLLLLKRK